MKNKNKITITADKAIKRMLMKRVSGLEATDSKRRLVQNMTKIEDICKDTADKIYEMRRKCFTIKEIAKAIGRRDRFVSAVIDYNFWHDVGFHQVKSLRRDGLSIKAIAKILHISDRIVSRVLKRR